jgi:polysaccharide biosynthesis transport protein
MAIPTSARFQSSAPGAAHGSGQIGWHSFLTAVRKQLWLSLSVTIAILIAAIAFGVSQKKIYQATAMIQIDPKPPTPLGQGVENVVEVGAASYWATQEYYNTQHRVISSKPIALTVVRNLGLDRDRRFIANTVEQPQVDKNEKPTTPDQAAAILLSRLKVEPVKESRLVELSYEDADKTRAVRILDALLQAYIENNLNQSVESTSAAATWLGEQLDTLRKELGSSELALHTYKLDKQIPTIGLEDQECVLLK